MYCRTETLPRHILDLLKEETIASQRDHVLNSMSLSAKTTSLLNREFACRGWPYLEYCMVFTWKAGVKQTMHIDGNPPKSIRKSSINVLVQGSGMFKWYDAPLVEATTSPNGIRAWGCNEDEAKLVYEVPLSEVLLVKTCVPHRVEVTSDTILLCLRVVGNPQLL